MNKPPIDEPVYMISIAARLVGMHPQSLRLYERKGLICPKRMGHKRLYSSRDIDRLRRIQQLTQDSGVNLAGVRIVFEILDKMERMRDELESRLEELEAELHEQVASKSD